MSPLIPPTQSKIHTQDDLAELAESWKKNGLKIVFTNGCFDILHAGHIKYLEAAAEQGDKLIVAANSDESVTKLKGSSRPINVLSSRMYILASLQCVDAVCSFEEDTPLEVIKKIKPDLLVKGGDYAVEDIVGGKEVLAWGGKVEVIPFVEGYSTTKIESRILDRFRNKNEIDS